MKLAPVVGLMLLMAFAVACGGGSDDNSGGSSATATSPASPTATTVPAGPSNTEMVALGEKEFTTCAGCHGADGTGIPNLGKNLVGSEFIANIGDSDLADLIKIGRPASDPANTTGIDMPPKGGNPALTSEKIDGLVAYIRSLQ